MPGGHPHGGRPAPRLRQRLPQRGGAGGGHRLHLQGGSGQLSFGEGPRNTYTVYYVGISDDLYILIMTVCMHKIVFFVAQSGAPPRAPPCGVGGVVVGGCD